MPDVVSLIHMKRDRTRPLTSQEIGWLDHVDPALAIGATNIVVSCQRCNQTKGQRTPEAAEMVLLPAPGARSASAPAARGATATWCGRLKS